MLFSSWLGNCKRSVERRWALHQSLRQKKGNHRRNVRPRLEPLEDRVLLSPYVVASTGDSGSGTLRDAINQANAAGSTITEIDFNIGTVGSAQTITPDSALPTLTANGVYINGLSQGGSSNTTPLIELNGTNAGSGSDGLLLKGTGCSVSGLFVDKFNNGIEVDGAANTIGGTATGAGNVISGNSNDGVFIDSGMSGVQVQGNFIGTNAAGTSALGNGYVGVEVEGSYDTIGGSVAGAGNVISSNGRDGVFLYAFATGVVVQGDFLGTNAAGTSALGNGDNGVEIDSSSSVTIGGTAAAARNIISGNGGDGVTIYFCTGTVVQGNYIGTNAAGTSALGNADAGVEEYSNNNDTIGGTAAGAANVISGNSDDGVLIDSNVSGLQVQGNYIGTNSSGDSAVGNINGVEIDCPNISVGSGNVISGNSNDGVYVNNVSGVEVLGNSIGINAAGTGAVANGWGVEVGGSSNDIDGINLISGNANDGVVIDSGVTGNTVSSNAIGTNNNYTNAVGNGGSGIDVLGNDNSVSGNVLDGNFLDGVLLNTTATGNQVGGNYIGLAFSQTTALANSGNGVEILGSSNTVGGTSTGFRNIISGNYRDGVLLGSSSSGNQLLGNYIGTDLNGVSAVGNSGNGVEIQGYSNIIGGSVSGAGNLISSNAQDGVLIDSDESGAQVQGNSIGIAHNGSSALGNGSYGIHVAGTNDLIGGAFGRDRNVISANGADGVMLESVASGTTLEGNYIGTNAAGTAALGNSSNGIEVGENKALVGGSGAALRNLISGNSGDGVLIDSGVSGVQVQGNFIGSNYLGTLSLANSNGVEVQGNSNTIGGTNNAARNLISGNSNDGVHISGNSNQVLANYIGTNYAGKGALANHANGVEAAGVNNTIGGTASGASNVIAGNGNDGILIDSGVSGTKVLGNWIGNAPGTSAIANSGNGVEVAGNSNNIGGTAYGSLNIISGNNKDGVLIDSSASSNQVLGNRIGTGTGGGGAVANKTNGVEVAGKSNTIGGTARGAGNLISGNTSNGVSIDGSASGTAVQGNVIGLNISSAPLANNWGVTISGSNNSIGGSISGAGNTIADNKKGGVWVLAGSGNTIRQNSIYANGSSNTGPGITLNSGANNNLAAPTISSATLNGTTLTVKGTFSAPTANVAYVLEFFANPTGDPEGKIYLGSLTVTPTSTGSQSFPTFTATDSVSATDPLITATLTDASGATSAFSTGVAS